MTRFSGAFEHRAGRPAVEELLWWRQSPYNRKANRIRIAGMINGLWLEEAVKESIFILGVKVFRISSKGDGVRERMAEPCIT